MKKVFISYRRDDSAAFAGRIHDRLAHVIGSDNLFMDVAAIPLGVNFVKVLREEVAKCDVLLAVIGRNWLDLRDPDGNRRVNSATDFVRIEIATALQRDIPVIPVLLEGARLPAADQLPDDLRELPLRNGIDVRHASFPSDMDRLVQELKALAGQTDAPVTPSAAGAKAPWPRWFKHARLPLAWPPSRRAFVTAVAFGGVLLLAALGWWANSGPAR